MQAGEKITLKELLSAALNLPVQTDCWLTGLALDSRKVQSGDLFLAYPGTTLDGRDFIDAAVNNGAVAVLCSDEIPKQLNLPLAVPIIVVPNLKTQVGLIAAQFYGYPSQHLTVIGVTGTNGKTSVVQFIATALTALQVPCGMISTLGYGFPQELTALMNTTPDPVTLQRILFKLKKAGARAVVIEVSSHALVQQRTNGINFKLAVFTNLSRDHLDYHGNMADYGSAKKLLFVREGLQYAIINADDDFGQRLLKELPQTLQVYAYTTTPLETRGVVIRARNFSGDITGITADVTTPWGVGTLKSSLLGRFNLSNLLAVTTVLGVMQLNLKLALAAIAELQTVRGRLQAFRRHKKPLIVVDYAHTPDALEQVLLVLREYCHGALWCVFGCGGDRDYGKRPIMGQIVERYSDHIIITNDNPRTEDPQRIINDILQGLLCPWAAEVEPDRRVAIMHAIDCAQANDVVLIAGRGHEEYQIIGNDRLPFSDVEVVREIVKGEEVVS